MKLSILLQSTGGHSKPWVISLPNLWLQPSKSCFCIEDFVPLTTKKKKMTITARRIKIFYDVTIMKI